MENPKKNSVFLHEDFEKCPIRLLEKTTLKPIGNLNLKSDKLTLKFVVLVILEKKNPNSTKIEFFGKKK
jgi:hypothetical protein